MADNLTSNESAEALRNLAKQLRVKPIALSGLIRPMLAAADEIDRLTAALKKANSNHEEFERRYYLEVNKTEDLTARNAELEQFVEWANPQIVTHGEDVLKIEALESRNAELVKALERLAQRRDRHHDCGDYERGYGDAEASASAIARAALKEPTT